MATVASTLFRLDRGYVAVEGPEADDFLERMLSNEVASLAVGEARQALLLTPKGRIVAPLRVVRVSAHGFLLITEAELAEPVAGTLLRARFAAKCEIGVRAYHGFLRLGPGDGIRVEDYGVEAYEGWGEGEVEGAPPEELEALRIEAGTPAWGKELDETVLPAEAGLEATHISFTKGCYPGQEPVARLHHRGHPNRGLRVLELENAQPGDELVYEGKVVGRITSAVPRRALAYVRREVPEEARLHLTPKRP
ncbi:MAG: CAF17-like 4Fe-4S cluster assembly/insertion protein YgfZ [Gaiellaceae bacterium]